MHEPIDVQPGETVEITVEINGRSVTGHVEPRVLLSDWLRHELRMTGTHVGCEHGVCGACTVHLDGRPARSCLMLAVQADGARITTIEGMESQGRLHPVQQAFTECHALQCGFCTPGFIMSSKAILEENPNPDEHYIRFHLAGNLCRCTGYDKIVRAVQDAAKARQEVKA